MGFSEELYGKEMVFSEKLCGKIMVNSEKVDGKKMVLEVPRAHLKWLKDDTI